MTFMVQFEVEGIPLGKGRPRFARRGSFVSTYTPKKTQDYEDLIKEHALRAMGSSEPLETPVKLILEICMAVPKSYSKTRRQACLDGFEKPTKKPDWDNVAKAYCDAMNGIVYKDDTQIVQASISKKYTTNPSVIVTIRESI